MREAKGKKRAKKKRILGALAEELISGEGRKGPMTREEGRESIRRRWAWKKWD